MKWLFPVSLVLQKAIFSLGNLQGGGDRSTSLSYMCQTGVVSPYGSHCFLHCCQKIDTAMIPCISRHLQGFFFTDGSLNVSLCNIKPNLRLAAKSDSKRQNKEIKSQVTKTAGWGSTLMGPFSYLFLFDFACKAKLTFCLCRVVWQLYSAKKILSNLEKNE